MGTTAKQDIFFYGGMDKDSSPELIAQGDYVDAINCRNTGSSVENRDGKLSKIKGNTFIPNNIEYDGDNYDFIPIDIDRHKVCGSVSDESSGKIYYFLLVANPEVGSPVAYKAQSICEYDVKSKKISQVLVSLRDGGGGGVAGVDADTFAVYDLFCVSEYISGCVLDGVLYWTDGITPPRSINIEKAKNYTWNVLHYLDPPIFNYRYPSYSSVTEETTWAVRIPPITPPSVKYKSNEDVTANFLRGKLFQFRYKFIYNDNSESVWSPISEIPYPYKEMFTNGSFADSTVNNYIELTMDVPSISVSSVLVATRNTLNLETPSETEWSNWRTTEKILANQIDTGADTLVFDFYNNTYGSDLSDDESTKPYDSIPIRAGKLETISNPDRLVYGDITEGYSNLDNVNVDISVSMSSLQTLLQQGVVKSKSFMLPYRYDSAVVLYNDYVNVYPDRLFYYISGAFSRIDIVQNDDISYQQIVVKYKYVKNNGEIISVTSTVDFDGDETTEEVAEKIINQINSDSGGIRAYSDEDFFSPDYVTSDETNTNQAKILIPSVVSSHTKEYARTKNRDSNTICIWVRSGQIIRDNGAEYSTFADLEVRFGIPRWWGSTVGLFGLYNEDVSYKIGKKYIENTLEKNEWSGANLNIVGSISTSIDYKLSNSEYAEWEEKRGLFSDSLEVAVLPTIFNGLGNQGYNISDTLVPRGEYGVGLVYYDKALRSSFVQPCVSLDNDSQNLNYLYITPSKYNSKFIFRCKIVVKHSPPSWAKYWSPVFTKNRKFTNYLEFHGTQSIASEDVGSGLMLININDSIGQWYDTFENVVIPEYQFNKGDRIIFYDITANGGFGGFIDKEILSQDDDGKLRVDYNGYASGTPNNDIARTIRIYTPAVSLLEDLYYEVGNLYPVVENNGKYYHWANGAEQQQTDDTNLELVVPFGDSYLNVIDYYKVKKGGADVIAPTYNAFFSPFYNSSVADWGRVNVVKENAKQKRYGSRLRWSNAYVQDTELNGIHSFDSQNYLDLSNKFGNITYLAEIGYTLKALCENKNVSIYVGRTAPINPDGSEDLFLTDIPLGTVRVPDAEWGCQHPESVVNNGRYLYFWDVKNGAVVRDASNGMTPISDYKMRTYFDNISKNIRNSQYSTKILGTFDRNNDELIYCINPYNANDVDRETVVFKEGFNRWTHRVGLGKVIPSSFIQPEALAFVSNIWVSFLNGQLYLQDSNDNYCEFFGSGGNALVEFVSNIEPKKIKTFQAISEHADKKWSAPNDGDIYIYPTTTYANGMSSRLKPNKFVNKEGVFYSEFMRDGLSGDTYIEGLLSGRKLRGNVLKVILRQQDNNEDATLFGCSIKLITSEYSY